MDKRLRGGNFLEEVLDNDFFIYCNSNDENARALSEKGKRSFWRNPLPLRLELLDSRWSVACVQMSLTNVQHVPKVLRIMDETSSKVEFNVDLPKQAFDDERAVLDAVLELAPTITSHIREDDVVVYRFTTLHSIYILELEMPLSQVLDGQLYGDFSEFLTALTRRYKDGYQQIWRLGKDDFTAVELDRICLTRSYRLLTPITLDQHSAMSNTAMNNRVYWYNEWFFVRPLTGGRDHSLVNGEEVSFHAKYCTVKFITKLQTLQKETYYTLKHPATGEEFAKIVGGRWAGFLGDKDSYKGMNDYGQPDFPKVVVEKVIDLAYDDATDEMDLRVNRDSEIVFDGNRTVKLTSSGKTKSSSFFARLRRKLFETAKVKTLDLHFPNLPFSFPNHGEGGFELGGKMLSQVDLPETVRNVFFQPLEQDLVYFSLKTLRTNYLEVRLCETDNKKPRESEEVSLLTGQVNVVLHFRRNYLHR